MRFPRADDVELTTARRRYVTSGDGEIKRYLHLLSGDFTGGLMNEPERTAFLNALHHDARSIDDADLEVLLQSEWRSRLTAAWLIAVDRREPFRERLADLLLASELVYSGQGYCLALARLGTEQDVAALTAYLDRYLARPDCVYDQDWALGALLYIDQLHGTSHATTYLAPDGVWERWKTASKITNARPAKIDRICAILDASATATAVADLSTNG